MLGSRGRTSRGETRGDGARLLLWSTRPLPHIWVTCQTPPLPGTSPTWVTRQTSPPPGPSPARLLPRRVTCQTPPLPGPSSTCPAALWQEKKLLTFKEMIGYVGKGGGGGGVGSRPPSLLGEVREEKNDVIKFPWKVMKAAALLHSRNVPACICFPGVGIGATFHKSDLWETFLSYVTHLWKKRKLHVYECVSQCVSEISWTTRVISFTCRL